MRVLYDEMCTLDDYDDVQMSIILYMKVVCINNKNNNRLAIRCYACLPWANDIGSSRVYRVL